MWSSPSAGQSPSQADASNPGESLPLIPPSIFLKAQAAVEYIIILSMVLILGTIILAVTGFFPTFSYSAQVGDSTRYWQTTASPIGIIDFTQSSTTLNAVLENKASANIQITSFKLIHGNAQYEHTSFEPLSPGEKLKFSMSAPDCSGRANMAYTVQIEYGTSSVSGLVQKGVKELYVQCQS